MGSVSTSIRGVRFTPYILGGNEWVRFPRHSVSGSTLLGLTWDSWCGKGTAPGCAWCLRGAMLLRGFRLFGVALHREPKGTKRYKLSMMSPWPQTPPPFHVLKEKETSKVNSLGQDPSDGTHKHQHRATIPLRTAWPNGVEQPKYPFYVPQLNNTH